MRIEIEISDFYLDENDQEQIESSLKQSIIQEVVRKINEQIKSNVETTITSVAKQMITDQMKGRIDLIIEEFIKSGTIKGDYSNEPEIKVEQYIKNKFNSKNGWGDPYEQIEKAAKLFGAELRSRYDLAFATQIVKNLEANKLLKDNVAELLLTSENHPKEKKQPNGKDN